MESISFPRAACASLLGAGLMLALPGAYAGEVAPEITTMDRKAELAQTGRYPPEMVERPGSDARFDGSFRQATTYQSADERFVVRLWQSGPGTLKTDAYPHDEYCLVLEGRVVVTNRSGTRAEYGVGDTFVIPKGWAGTWDMPVRFTKQFVAMER